MGEELEIKKMSPAGSRFTKAWFDLPDKHRQFFQKYWLGRLTSGAKAARDVGYDDAAKTSYAILHSIKGREVMEAYLDETGCTPTTLLADLERINQTSIYDFRQLFGGDTQKKLEKLNDKGVDLRQIRKLKVTRRTTGTGEKKCVSEEIALEMYDRLGAIDKMAKARKMFGPTAEEVGDTLEAFLEAAYAIRAKSVTQPEASPE